MKRARASGDTSLGSGRGDEASYECERCGGTEPEEITGGYRCAACGYVPAECTCYEMTGGHQPGCAFNAALASRSGSSK